MNSEYYIDRIIGSQLVNIGHAADMVWIIIGDVSIHLQLDTIVYLGGEMVTQTRDIFRDAREISDDKSQPQTIFDIKVGELLQQKQKFFVTSVSIDSNLNLCIIFSNRLMISTVTDISSEPDDEKWRILIKGSNLPHMVAEGMSVNWY